MSGCLGLLREKPWLLPAAYARSLGVSNARELAAVLGVPRRLANSLARYLDRLEGCEAAVARRGHRYAWVDGGTVYVAVVRARRVSWYTVPWEAVENPEAYEGRLGYRARLARLILGLDEGSSPS
ncbi:MAG: hypothetical protein GSR78_00130 [Desulfurococcales archaeon]|nr:hypothetical protein [Desulfurococcales archaeon]